MTLGAFSPLLVSINSLVEPLNPGDPDGFAVSSGRVLIMRSDATRGSGVPVHVHQRKDEIFVLLEGALSVWAGDQQRELSAGGIAVLPEACPTPAS